MTRVSAIPAAALARVVAVAGVVSRVSAAPVRVTWSGACAQPVPVSTGVFSCGRNSRAAVGVAMTVDRCAGRFTTRTGPHGWPN